MGIFVDGTCHADDDAGRILLQASYPVVTSISPSGDLISWQLKFEDPDGFSGQQWLWVKTINGHFETFVGTSDMEVYCDPQQSLQDGVSLGWLVGSVLIGAAIFKLMQRAMS
ncbi:hypothetical protein [Methyloversatilis universalis]|uniref:hypothetical protein n=1 Tax=Methyloversatilis universalis TaxID=378211 RepID=UPI000374DA5A|nr:hypothetical protein [Methyloversatilis universalis]